MVHDPHWRDDAEKLAMRARQIRRERMKVKGSLRSALDTLNKLEMEILSELYELVSREVPCFDPKAQSPGHRNGKIPQGVRRRVLRRSQQRCEYCDCEVVDGGKQHKNDRLVFDHIIPRWCGGPSADWNVVVSCYRCNQQKGGGQTGRSMELLLERLSDD